LSKPVKEKDVAAILDEYLVVQSQLGDAEAFGHLVARWQPRFLRYARCFTANSEAAKDVAQESWLGIVKGLRSLRDPERFRSWALRIVANKARDWVRREDVRGKAARRAASEAPTAGTADAPPSEMAEAVGAVERVRAGLDGLEAGQRCVLTWYYLEDMTVPEIAAALSVPEGTVKSRLFYAREALRARLEEA
jgi:RNA polymerase sigma-70 factor (ECF subfamily)